MKKITLLITFIMLRSTVFTSVNAQASFHAPKIFKEPATTTAAKSKSTESMVNKTELNFRIAKRFKREFAVVQDESWIKTSSGFLVRFKDDQGASTSAFLDKGGNCTGTIRYYDEKLLPSEVRTLVKSTYFDYTIIGVTEVKDNTDPYEPNKAYLVIIDDPTTRKVIRVIDGAMDEYKSFTKK